MITVRFGEGLRFRGFCSNKQKNPLRLNQGTWMAHCSLFQRYLCNFSRAYWRLCRNAVSKPLILWRSTDWLLPNKRKLHHWRVRHTLLLWTAYSLQASLRGIKHQHFWLLLPSLPSPDKQAVEGSCSPVLEILAEKPQEVTRTGYTSSDGETFPLLGHSTTPHWQHFPWKENRSLFVSSVLTPKPRGPSLLP